MELSKEELKRLIEEARGDLKELEDDENYEGSDNDPDVETGVAMITDIPATKSQDVS